MSAASSTPLPTPLTLDRFPASIRARAVLALAAANLPALTKWDVLGHGKQQGIQVGSQLYQDLSKAMMLVVVEDELVDSTIQVIQDAAFTGYPGDGKIFVSHGGFRVHHSYRQGGTLSRGLQRVL